MCGYDRERLEDLVKKIKIDILRGLIALFFMIGKLDVDEDVMDDSLIAKRKAAAVMKTVSSKLSDTIAALG